MVQEFRRNLVKPQDPKEKTPSLSAAVKIKPVEAAKDLQQPRRLFWHSDLNATCLEWLSFGDAQKKNWGIGQLPVSPGNPAILMAGCLSN